jgi:hypothetical protein
MATPARVSPSTCRTSRLVSAWKRLQGRRPIRRRTGEPRAQPGPAFSSCASTTPLGRTTTGRGRPTWPTASLPVPIGGASSAPDTGERLAAYLADILAGWQVATSAERNRLARQLFNRVVIDNRTAVDVTPRPDLLPFFAARSGDPSSLVTHGRKRRASVHRLHDASRVHRDRRGSGPPAQWVPRVGILSSSPSASVVSGADGRHPKAHTNLVLAIHCRRVRREPRDGACRTQALINPREFGYIRKYRPGQLNPEVP